MWKNRLRALTLTLVCSASASAGEALNDQQWTAFDDKLTELQQSAKLPGMAAAVVKDGRLVWGKGYGFADANREIPVTLNTPFWIASVTKTFVGLTFLTLAEQGKIDLDDLAADTPNFTRTCEWLASTSIPFAEGLSCDAPIRIRHILHHQVSAPVGTTFMYNPIMYSRLSRYLEDKLGQGVDAVEGRHNILGQMIDKHILEPAGMTRTLASMWDKTKASVYVDLADGFEVNNKGQMRKLPQPDKHIPGGAGVVSTAADLAKYEIALQQGIIAGDSVAKKLHEPAAFEDGTVSPYGFGWYFEEYQGRQLMWHSGWDEDAGYSAIFLRVPNENMAFIVLANGEGLWWGNALTKAEIHKSEFAQLFLSVAL